MKPLFAIFLFSLVVIPCLHGEDSSPYARIEQYVLAPPKFPPLDQWKGDFMKAGTDAFIRRLGMTHDEFSAVIIEQYGKSYGEPSNHLYRVLTMLLPRLTDTNTVPFVRSILADKDQKDYWGAALYILAQRGEEEDFGWFQGQLSSDWLDEGLREQFYLGCRTRLSLEIEKPDPYSSFTGNPCYDALKDALEKESSLNTRMQIDTLFDDYLKGWRASEEREILLRRWLAESEGQYISKVIGIRLKKLATAREKGDTLVVCERPPRKDPSPEEVERRMKKAREERAARMQKLYDGPLVVEMDEDDME